MEHSARNNVVFFQLSFGEGRQAQRYQLGCWATPEPGWTWACYPQASLQLPRPEADTEIGVILEVTPALTPPSCVSRRLQVSVDEHVKLDVNVFRAEAFLIRVLENTTTDSIVVNFKFDKPLSDLQDSRALAFAFHRVTIVKMPIRALPLAQVRRFEPNESLQALALDVEVTTGISTSTVIMGFESLGATCDFGMLQRKLGAEPIGLLRFAGIDVLELVRGLFARFEELGNPGSSELLSLPGAEEEYFVRERTYGIGSHTAIRKTDAAPEQILAREVWRLPFLRRHFLEVVDNAEKIFLLRRAEGLVVAQVEAVCAALRLTGDNKILWANQDRTKPPGLVEWITPNIIKGNLDIVDDVGSSSDQMWLAICASAYVSFRSAID